MGNWIPQNAKVGEPTPQTDPDMFDTADIKAEIRYLLSLNRKHGTLSLRVAGIAKLRAELAARS